MLNKNEFELIYNIKPNEKIYFNDLKLELPNDFDKKNYTKIKELFNDIKGEPYSINKVEKILEEIENITINEQFMSIKALIDENIVSNKLDITFKIDEAEKYFVKNKYFETILHKKTL